MRASARLGSDLPMHEDSATPVQGVLYEVICGREMLQQIFVLDVIHFDNHVLGEWLEELLIEWRTQDGQDVCNVGLLQCFTPAQGEHANPKLLDWQAGNDMRRTTRAVATAGWHDAPANVQLQGPRHSVDESHH